MILPMRFISIRLPARLRHNSSRSLTSNSTFRSSGCVIDDVANADRLGHIADGFIEHMYSITTSMICTIYNAKASRFLFTVRYKQDYRVILRYTRLPASSWLFQYRSMPSNTGYSINMLPMTPAGLGLCT